MEKIIFIIGLGFILGCNSENAWDCVQDSGAIIEREFQVEEFKKIQVWERVQLIISQGAVQNVRVETGENLMNEIQVVVKDSVLTISNRNSCNWVRDYGITKVYVTAPDITEIRNSSGLTAESFGVLKMKDLRIISEDPQNMDEYHHDGDFKLDLDVEILRVRANGISKFYLTGKAGYANFRILDGDVRVEAQNLEVSVIEFYHRSTNKLIINPIRSLTGEIRGIGNVIATNHPLVVNVEEFYTGRLIFE